MNTRVDLSYNDGLLEITSLLEEGGWIIRSKKGAGMINLYSVPLYGGKEELIGTYAHIAHAIDQASRLA